MPGTPVAKSASRSSLNSLRCFWLISSLASTLRSSGLSGGSGSGDRSPSTRSVGGRPTFRCRSEAFCWIICCRIALKLNVLVAGAPCVGTCAWGAAAARCSAIGVDTEEHLSVLDRRLVLGEDLLDHA